MDDRVIRELRKIQAGPMRCFQVNITPEGNQILYIKPSPPVWMCPVCDGKGFVYRLLYDGPSDCRFCDFGWIVDPKMLDEVNQHLGSYGRRT